MRPHRNSPLPLLDNFGVGLFDKGPDAGQRFAPPITEPLEFPYRSAWTESHLIPSIRLPSWSYHFLAIFLLI